MFNATGRSRVVACKVVEIRFASTTCMHIIYPDHVIVDTACHVVQLYCELPWWILGGGARVLDGDGMLVVPVDRWVAWVDLMHVASSPFP